MIFDNKWDDGSKRATSQCLRNKCKNGIKRTEEKTTSSTSNELEKHLQEKGRTEVLENEHEKSKLVVGLWKTSRNIEVKFCH